jgi:pre-mRNA-splicing factor ATP-dependent RNA helicase DHX16
VHFQSQGPSWCALAGLSEKALADYCISIAKKSSNINDLATLLENQGFPKSTRTSTFASDLLQKLPSPGSSNKVSHYKQQEKVATKLAKQNESYGLLMDDGGDAEFEKLLRGQQQKEDGGTQKRKESRKRKLRKSKTGESDEDEDGTGTGIAGSVKMTAEEARLQDLAEKEEFEKRLKERDEQQTRKLAERKISKEELEELERRKRAEKAEDKAQVIKELRKVSRREYLKKREEAKLEELEEALEDEKYLFEGHELTEKERAELEYKEKVFKIAKERKKQLEELEHDDAYHMPTAYDQGEKDGANKRYEVLTARYRDVDEEEAGETPWEQQEALEREQIKKAVTRVGSKDKKKSQDEYDLVFEDQIDFIIDSYMKGDVLVRHFMLLGAICMCFQLCGDR